MSRIDDALRRVAGEELPRESAAAIDGSATALPPESLERYPRERQVPSPRTRREDSARRPAFPAIHGKAAPPIPSVPTDDEKLVTSVDVSPLVSEQYGRLAAALHQLNATQELKTLVVTSAVPREGKTLTVANLALTLSGSYKRRVLLIDSDLRRPSVHEIFRIGNSIGLSEALRPGAAAPCFVEVSPNLTILTGGRPVGDPMGLLTSERLRELLADASSVFDWVLLDTPPVGLMPDATVLARLTGAVLFVIGAGSTPYYLVERAIAELGRDCIVGTVLNRLEDQRLPVAEYYHAYYSPSGGTTGASRRTTP